MAYTALTLTFIAFAC